jgi:hypothetical protein
VPEMHGEAAGGQDDSGGRGRELMSEPRKPSPFLRYVIARILLDAARGVRVYELPVPVVLHR